MMTQQEYLAGEKNDWRGTAGAVGGVLFFALWYGLFVRLMITALPQTKSLGVLIVLVGFVVIGAGGIVTKAYVRHRFCVHFERAVGHEKVRCRFCGRVRHLPEHERVRHS